MSKVIHLQNSHGFKALCRDAEEMLMAEQDELAAGTQRQKPKKLLRLRIYHSTESYGTGVHPGSLTSVRYTSSVGRIYITSPGPAMMKMLFGDKLVQ